jgi:hypothetical protein
MELKELPIERILLKKETMESDRNFSHSINEVLEKHGLTEKMQSPKDPNAHLYSRSSGGLTVFYGDYSYDDGRKIEEGNALIVYQGMENWLEINNALYAREKIV